MRNRVSELSGDEVSILELKQGHRSFLHVYGALVAIVSYVPKETQRTQGQWDGYHVIIWRSRSAPHTALSVTCATRERLQDGRRARQTVQIAAKRPAPPPSLDTHATHQQHRPNHHPTHSHAEVSRPHPTTRPTPDAPPRTAHPPSRIEPLAPATPQNMPPPSHSAQLPTRGRRRPHKKHTPGVRHALTHAEQPLRSHLTKRPDRVRWNVMRANRATGNLPAG